MTDEDLKNLLSTHATEIRRHFAVSAENIEKRFDLLSESVDQKLDRNANELHEEMKRGFADTQAMTSSLTPNSTAACVVWKRASDHSRPPSAI